MAVALAEKLSERLAKTAHHSIARNYLGLMSLRAYGEILLELDRGTWQQPAAGSGHRLYRRCVRR